MSEPKIVWLVVVSFDTLAKPNEKSIHVRTHPYELKGKCYYDAAGNDERDAPMGLRRVNVKDLPKAGGYTGRVVVALNEHDARKHLAKLLLEEFNETTKKADTLSLGLRELAM